VNKQNKDDDTTVRLVHTEVHNHTPLEPELVLVHVQLVPVPLLAQPASTSQHLGEHTCSVDPCSVDLCSVDPWSVDPYWADPCWADPCLVDPCVAVDSHQVVHVHRPVVGVAAAADGDVREGEDNYMKVEALSQEARSCRMEQN